VDPGNEIYQRFLNSKDDTGCIIDDPPRTLAHPMIDFDVKNAADSILATAFIISYGRTKPVFALR